MLASAMPVALAYVTTSMLDRLDAGVRSEIVALALMLAAMSVVASGLPYVVRHLVGEFDRRISYHGQARLFDAVNGLAGLAKLEDPEFHDRLRLAQMAARLAPGRMIDSSFGVAQALLTMFGFLVALFSLNPWLAALVAVSSIPLLPAEIALSRRRVSVEEALSKVQRREAFYQGLLTRLDAAKEIRLFNLGGFLRDRMLAEHGVSNDISRRLERRQYLARGMLATLGAFVVGVGLAWLVYSGDVSPSAGEVALYLASAAGVYAGIQMCCSSIGLVIEMLHLMEHYQIIVGAEPDLPRLEGVDQVVRPDHGIELHDVWFRYGPDLPWILRGVSVVLPAGWSVGLVGLNGAGKSTLVKLLCRLYDPNHGSITWDGVDIRAMDVKLLRERIGVVFQDFMDYELSVQENIGVGDLTQIQQEDRIVEAARQAGIHDHIASLAKGYGTLLSRVYLDNADREDHATGVVLSGGQWQRIALARAFLRGDRDLLIMDEPSSGLDPESEYQIGKRLHRLRGGSTTLLISHRLNTIRDADLIIVLEDGRIVEHGGHASLMQHGGRYARLFEMQAGGYTATPAGRS